MFWSEGEAVACDNINGFLEGSKIIKRFVLA